MTRNATATGTIWAVFGHRLSLEGPDGKVLVDLGPKAVEGLALTVGETVTVEGERTPCEIKVSRLVRADGTVRIIERQGKGHGPGDPEAALRVALAAGYRVEGMPVRKPKHFELRGIRDGAPFEIHVHDDGSIRKSKSLAG
ncbi:hypothetical protein [Methylobacterium sp. 77]|uniref:hypothetical protein n=1 Tax=Methylobacterium sp. 77 TaxID=1101192 RepID=UPI000370D5F0|nr:hypothetical protein [Methylobacterium sp. 77]